MDADDIEIKLVDFNEVIGASISRPENVNVTRRNIGKFLSHVKMHSQ